MIGSGVSRGSYLGPVGGDCGGVSWGFTWSQWR